jgi:hypothetical protein
MSAQAKNAEDCHYDDDESYQIHNTVHGRFLRVQQFAKAERATCDFVPKCGRRL